MVKRDKQIERMRRNPRNVRPDDINALLTGAGFTSHQEGSHKTYRRDGEKLTIPQRKPFLKPAYVRAALVLLAANDDDKDENNDRDEGDSEDEEDA